MGEELHEGGAHEAARGTVRQDHIPHAVEREQDDHLQHTQHTQGGLVFARGVVDVFLSLSICPFICLPIDLYSSICP